MATKKSQSKPKTKRKPTKKVKRAKPSKKTTKKKAVRKGPTISALKVPIGTICYGNDGQLWKVKLAGKSQRWVRAKMVAAAHAKHKFRSSPCASKVH